MEGHRETSSCVGQNGGGRAAEEVAVAGAALFSRKTFSRRLRSLSRSCRAGPDRDGVWGTLPASSREGASTFPVFSYPANPGRTEGREVPAELPITDCTQTTDAQNLSGDPSAAGSQRDGQQAEERAAADRRNSPGEQLRKGPSLAAHFLAAGAAAPGEPLLTSRPACADGISLSLFPRQHPSSVGPVVGTVGPLHGGPAQGDDFCGPYLGTVPPEKNNVWTSRRLARNAHRDQRSSEQAARAFVVEWERGAEAASRACALLSRVGQEEPVFSPLGHKGTGYAGFLEGMLSRWIRRVLDDSAGAQSQSACFKAGGAPKGTRSVPSQRDGSPAAAKPPARDSWMAAATAIARLCGLCACLAGCLRLGALFPVQGDLCPALFPSLLSLCSLLTAEGQPKNLAGDFFTCLLVSVLERDNTSQHQSLQCTACSTAAAAHCTSASNQRSTSRWMCMCPGRAPESPGLTRTSKEAATRPLLHALEALRQTPVVRQQRQLLVLVLCELRDTALLFLADCVPRTSRPTASLPQSDYNLVDQQLRGIFQHEVQLCMEGLLLGKQGMSNLLHRSTTNVSGASTGSRLSLPQARPVLLTEAGDGAAGAACAASAAAVSFAWWWWLCGCLVRCFVAAQKRLLPPWVSRNARLQQAETERGSDSEPSGVKDVLPSREWLPTWQQIIVQLAKEQQHQQWEVSRPRCTKNPDKLEKQTSRRAGAAGLLRHVDLKQRCVLVYFKGLALVALGEAETRSRAVLGKAGDDLTPAHGTATTDHSALSGPEPRSLSSVALAFGQALLMFCGGEEQIPSGSQNGSSAVGVPPGVKGVSSSLNGGEGARTETELARRARPASCDRVAACGFLGVLQGLHVLGGQQKEEGSECLAENQAGSSHAVRTEAEAAIGVTMRLLLEDALREGHCRVSSERMTGFARSWSLLCVWPGGVSDE